MGPRGPAAWDRGGGEGGEGEGEDAGRGGRVEKKG